MSILVTSDTSTDGDLLQDAKGEVDAFDRFFQERLGNSPMTPSERAILMTYIHYAVVDKAKG